MKGGRKVGEGKDKLVPINKDRKPHPFCQLPIPYAAKMPVPFGIEPCQGLLETEG